MATPLPIPPKVERLAGFLLDGGVETPLGEELQRWMTRSARFRRFAELNQDKIRKKLRGAVGADSRRDVRAELNVARLLLADKRIDLEFEAYGSGNAGPDFTAALGGERFNIEVTRIRGDARTCGFGTILAKIRQLPPSVANAVVLSIEGSDATAYDVGASIAVLRARADSADEALFNARGFNGSRGFRERLARLGAAYVFAEDGGGEARASSWHNSSARIAFPARANRACLACLRAED